MKALDGKRTVIHRPTRGTRETLLRIVKDPSIVGFAQYDNYRRFMSSDQDADTRLEFYGDVPYCVLAAARANSPWALPPDELSEDLKPKTIDIGPADADTAASLSALVASAPRLSGVAVEHRGGSRGLSRLRQRATDIMFFIEYPDRGTPIVADILSGSDVVFLTSPTMLLDGGKSDVQGAFVPTRIVVPTGGWFSPDREISTVCTPFGVVVNSEGDIDTLDFVVRAATEGALINGRSDGFWSTVGSMLRRTWTAIVDGVTYWSE